MRMEILILGFKGLMSFFYSDKMLQNMSKNKPARGNAATWAKYGNSPINIDLPNRVRRVKDVINVLL